MYKNIFKQLVIKNMQITNIRDDIFKLTILGNVKKNNSNVDECMKEDSQIRKKYKMVRFF